jgi:hypothetical protein
MNRERDRRIRIAGSAAAAGACALFAAAFGWTEYAGVRVRPVREPIRAAADGVQVPIDAAGARGLAAPFAVIARIDNASGAAAAFTVDVDGRAVCEPTVAPGRASRVDCVFEGGWDAGADHRVTIRSAAASWTLEGLELATHHGSNSGLVRFLVLPAASRQYRPPGAWTCVALWALLTGALLLPMPRLPGILIVAHRAVIGLLAAWMAAVALVPMVSGFRVIVSVDSFAHWLLVCLAPQLVAAAWPPVWAFMRARTRAARIMRAGLAGGLAALCFAAVVGHRVAVEYRGNLSGLLLLSRDRVQSIPMLAGRDDIARGLILLDGGGYDGQFMYAIAFDPLLCQFPDRPRAYQPFIDAPPYRYGRVGYPALARVLTLGDPARLPLVMIGLVFAGAWLCGWGVGLAARRAGGREWWGLLVALVPGFWMSFRAGLPEPLAAAAVVGGYLCVRDRRWVAAGLLLAAACLVRETAAFFVVVLAGWLIWTKQARQALWLLALALGPLAVWRLYVGWIFAPGWGFEAYWNPPDDFGAPFAGLVTLWSQLARGEYWPDLWPMRRASGTFSLLVVAASILAWVLAWRRPTAVTISAAVFAVMTVCFNVHSVWVQAGNAERLTSDLFLFLALASAEAAPASRRWRLALLTFWGVAAAYLLFGTLDAEFTRRAVGLGR